VTAVAIVFAILALFLLIYVAAGVRIVRPHQKGIVEHLGKYKATVEAGLRVIIPLVQSIRLIDMREQVVDVPPQEVITSDNVSVTVDAVVYYEPTDPQRLLYRVGNFLMAVTKLAQTNLRNVIGDMTLDEALTVARQGQRQPAPDPRRRHRQLGRAGRASRDPAHRPAARRHERHARADASRADPPSRGHPGRGRAHRRHHPRRG
jgi:regulator of protease activity HflC (stomatin/prohibitin superfamily)